MRRFSELPQKRVLKMPKFSKPKRQKTDAKIELKRKQKEFVKLLKSLDKTILQQAVELVGGIYPAAVQKKRGGKKTIRVGLIRKASRIEELMNSIECLRTKNLKEVPLNLRKHREYQLRISIEGRNVWRAVVVSGANTLHDLSRVCMVSFHWMPAQTSAVFRYKNNTGQPFGEFSVRKEVDEQITNRTSFQKFSVAEVFLEVGASIKWKYGDKAIKITCEGVTPGRDKIARGLPRCVGGEGIGPPHLESLKSTWRPTWDQDTILVLNETFLGDRFIRDGFKKTSEFELDQHSAIRRCCPFFNEKGDLLKPFTDKVFMYPPMDPSFLGRAFHFKMRCVRKAEVREGMDPASNFLCGLDMDSKVIVDEINVLERRARLIHPVKGWVYTRTPEGKRILQEVKHVRDNDESYKI